MTAVILTYDDTLFRMQFPFFANSVTFPEALLQMYWDQAICYMDDTANYGWLQGVSRQLGLNMLTAHLTYLTTITLNNQVTGLMQNATVDKVSIGLTPPPLPNQWQWWLDQTSYGQSLLALLQSNIAGGLYIGGSPQLSAFRNVGGVFGCY